MVMGAMRELGCSRGPTGAFAGLGSNYDTLRPAPERLGSTFDAHHLLQRVHDFDQIGLVCHHLFDVLVSRRDLVEHALVLAAFDALRLRDEVRARKAAFGFAPAHAATGPVGAGAERLRVAFAEHDVGARAHAARDDAELAFARADRALARDVDALAEVLLLLDVVVVAVDRFVRRLELRKIAAQGAEDEAHHLAPVGESVVLRPTHRVDVVVEELRALAEPGEIAVGKVDVGFQHRLARRGDEIPAYAVADASTARVQHHPQVLAFVEAELDEVIAAAQRPHLPHPFLLGITLHLRDLRMPANDFRKAPRERRAGFAARSGLAVLVEPDRHRPLDRGAYAREAVGKLLRLEGESHGVYAASNVHADRRGDDRAPGRNDRAHGRADSGMHVGHRRDVAEHDRQLRHVGELLPRMSLDVVGENLDRHAPAFDDLSDWHWGGGASRILRFPERR